MREYGNRNVLKKTCEVIALIVMTLTLCACSEMRKDSVSPAIDDSLFTVDTAPSGSADILANEETANEEKVEKRIITDNVYATYDYPIYENVSIYRAYRSNPETDQLLGLCEAPVIEEKYGNYVTSAGEMIGEDQGGACWYYSEDGNRFSNIGDGIRNHLGLNAFNCNEEFDFASFEDVERHVKKFLASLGVDSCSCNIYPVSKELFDEIYKLNDELVATYDMGRSSSDTFGRYQEFYYITVRPTVDGIEFYDNHAGYIEKGTVVFGTDIRMTFSPKGIESISFMNGYATDEVIEKDVQIINAQDAEQLLISKFENLLMYEPVTFSKLGLMYFQIPSNYSAEENHADYYVMTPVWSFIAEDGKNIYFNAIDGKEIPE